MTDLKNKEYFVPFKYNYIFKYLFNKKENMILLENFLSCLLNVDRKLLSGNIRILNNELIKAKEDIGARVDLLIEVNDVLINIEVNKSRRYTDNILTKCNYYMYSLLRGDIAISKDTRKYQHLHKKIIQVNLNTFSMYADVLDPKQVFVLYDVVNSVVIKSSNAEIHHINIDMCFEEWYNSNIKEVDNLTRWYALIGANTKEEIEKIIAYPGFLNEKERERIRMTMEEIDYSRYYFETLTPEEERRGIMDSEFEAEMEEIEIEKKEINAQKEEINAQRKKISLEFDEKQNKIIKNMLSENMDVDTICRITGMEKNKILEIKNK